jgi:lipopolysaccharide transport system permease protein
MIAQLVQLFRYRLLIQTLVSRELKARYRGSVLGFLWSFVNPLLMLLTYALVFTYVMRTGKGSATPYWLFLFVGILPWTWFNAAVVEASGVLMSSGGLIKKVLFPAEVLPVVTVMANMVHFSLGLPILLFFLILQGKLTLTALLLPLPIIVQFIFTLGLALFVSALTVHFRDVQDILNHVVHLWFWASPVIYVYGEQNVQLRIALRFNPLTHIMLSYQQILFWGKFDHWRGLALTAILGLIGVAIGAFVFDRLRDTLAEEV